MCTSVHSHSSTQVPLSLPSIPPSAARVGHEIPGLIKPTGTDGPLAVSAVCQPYTATLNVAKCFRRGGVWELGPRAGGVDLPDVISCGR